MAKAEAQQITLEELQKQEAELQAKVEAIRAQQRVIQNKNFYDVLEQAKDKGITKEQLSNFINSLIEDEKILVVYDYTDDDGKAKQSILRLNAKGQNVFIRHCREKKITKEQALTYARNEAGRQKVEEIFKA